MRSLLDSADYSGFSCRAARTAVVFALAMVITGVAADSGHRVTDFALLDQSGKLHQLSHYGDHSAVVLLATAAGCADFLDTLPAFRALRSRWESRGVVFLGLASGAEPLTRLAQRLEANRINLPVLRDASTVIANEMALHEPSQLLVIDPSNLRLLHRGSIASGPEQSGDDKQLARVLTVLVNGQDDLLSPLPESATHEAVKPRQDSCNWPSAKATVPDYGADIAPILQDNCVTCHRAGGVAPFAMDSHRMVQGWSSMIKEVLLERRMPPAQLDPSVNHFSNANYLAPQDLRALVRWIDAGAPRGSAADDPLIAVASSEPVWDLGEPDYIVQLPAFTVPATGVLDYENVTVALPFEEDRWVKSVQHLPGDRRALHHLLSFVVPAGFDRRIEEGENDQSRELLEGYAPGKEQATTFPEGSGVLIPAGSAIQLSLHYTTFGKQTVDSSRIGLYFSDSPLHRQYSTFALSNGGAKLQIPPRAQEHRVTATHVFGESIVLHGLRPHMHYRGKYMRISVVYPDGNAADIINVPDYNFAWQPTYRLSEPMRLPAGSRVIVEGAFDNSAYNLGNPDPDAVVTGGAQSWDEMFIAYFSYHVLDDAVR